ncbi:lipid II:glycine glycyltransferase FemX [Flavobacterium sp. N502540]|uniref:lipid II:glycine glycyltransferase FemX n=1 Tax=Flavobacterium sp. N502540 TaxID=2986838 RepID=UPI002225ACF7|nr:aminoacyltransferase [Flavobacterium sp. N502540]
MQILFTKESYWLDKWDEFVSNNNRGNHLILSDWLASYKSYGFDFELGICLDNDEIVGGLGAVIAKMGFFKFYIVPHGPIFNEGFENIIAFVIKELVKRAKKVKCCYLQYSLPFSNDAAIASYSYGSDLKDQIEGLGSNGNLFKYVYSSYGINWLSFNETTSAEELLQKFTIQARRNINLGYRNDIQIGYPKSEEDCRLAYKLIEDNAKQSNYSVRAFEDFKTTILSLIDKNKAFLLTVSFNNEIKGAAFIVNCGNYLSYISGGTKKEKPDLNIGYIIHWEAIKKSYELGFRGYNISMGGSQGVLDFKAKFMAEPIFFDHPHYHLIIRSGIFKMYLFLNEYFKKNKAKISRILKRIK